MIFILLLIFLFVPSVSEAQFTSEPPGLYVTESDGSPAGRYRILIFDNNTLTDNGDGTVTFGSGPAPSTSAFLLESGDYFLLESGDYWLLE